MLVSGGTHAGEFIRLLGNGREYGIDRHQYGYHPVSPAGYGLPHAISTHSQI